VRVHILMQQDIRSRASSCCSTETNDNTDTAVQFIADEAYTCDQLHTLRHKLLTKPVQILQQLTFLDSLPQIHTLVDMPVIATGQIDGICIWFDMHLDNSSDDSSIVSTTPSLSLSDNSSSVTTSGWDQAVYFVKRDWCIADNSSLDSIGINVSYCEDKISFKDANNGESIHISDQRNSQTLTYKISELEVALLNDDMYTNAYSTAVSTAATGKRVLDICSANWLNTVTVAAAIKRSASAVTVCCKSDDQLQCINSIASKCNAAHNTACHISCDDIMTTLQRLQQRADGAAIEVIVTDLIEPSGLIRQGAIEDLLLAVTACTQQRVLKCQQHQSHSTCTSTTSAATLAAAAASTVVTIPSSLTVVFQGYYCSNLDVQRKVFNDRTVGIDVSDINNYGVSIIDAVRLIEYTPVTSIERSEDLLYQIGSSSDSNTAHSSEDFADTIVLTATTAGYMNAIAFWYEIGIASNENAHSTYTVDEDVNSSCTHFRQAVYLLDAALAVKPHKKVAVEVRGQYATIISVSVT
jgi:hypothetical protein